MRRPPAGWSGQKVESSRVKPTLLPVYLRKDSSCSAVRDPGRGAALEAMTKPTAIGIATNKTEFRYPIWSATNPIRGVAARNAVHPTEATTDTRRRSEEHTSELQSRGHLVC